MKVDSKNLTTPPVRGRAYLRPTGKRNVDPVHGDVESAPLPPESVIHKLPHSKTEFPRSTEEEYEEPVTDTVPKRRYMIGVGVGIILALIAICSALIIWLFFL